MLVGVSWSVKGFVDKDNNKEEIRHTRHFAADASVGWPYAIASLERLNTWSVTALRVGTLLLLQQSVRSMAQPGARKALLIRHRELLAALEHIPWDE